MTSSAANLKYTIEKLKLQELRKKIAEYHNRNSSRASAGGRRLKVVDQTRRIA